MKDEAHKPLRDGSRRFSQYPTLGGKTGTPERVIVWESEKVDRNANDAWYICFVSDATVSTKKRNKHIMEVPTSLAIAVRIERTGNTGSAVAKGLVHTLVMPILHEMGYVK